MLSIQYSYEQLTHIHPEVDEYKLYYAQVSFNGEYSPICVVPVAAQLLFGSLTTHKCISYTW